MIEDLELKKREVPGDFPVVRVVGDRVVIWDYTGEVGSYPLGDIHSNTAVLMFKRVPTRRLRQRAKQYNYARSYGFTTRGSKTGRLP